MAQAIILVIGAAIISAVKPRTALIRPSHSIRKVKIRVSAL
jgi:hypothetical protein